MEKTWASPTWKTPLAFPTFPQLRRRVRFIELPVRILGAGHTVAQLLGQSTIQMTLPCGSGPGVESGSVERLVAPRLKTATECRTSGAAFVGARHGGLG